MQTEKKVYPNRTRALLVAIRLLLFLLMVGICWWQAGSFLGKGFSLPDCKQLLVDVRFSTCEWILEENVADQTHRLILIVDGVEGASVELERIDVRGVPEFEASPYKEGWGAYIEVAEGYRNSGLGEQMWRLGDAVIKHKYGTGQVRIFVDASLNNPNFAKKILGKIVPVYVSSGGDDFVYIIH